MTESDQSVIAVIGSSGQLKGFIDQQYCVQLCAANLHNSDLHLSQVIDHNPSAISQLTISQNMWKKLSENNFWRGEIWNRNKQHELYVAETTISAIKSISGQLTNYISVFSDVSLLKEQQKRLEMLAHYDALTQLPNRILLADRIVKAQTQAERTRTLLAVCYLDLDGFKPINDQYGHNIGDDLLIEVSGRLEDTIRSEDTVADQSGREPLYAQPVPIME